MKKSKISQLITFTTLAMACFSTPAFSDSTAPEKSTCLFYEHFDYKGKHFGLYKRDVLVTSNNVPSSSVYGTGPVGKRFVSKEWAGRVSSFRVPPNCEAIVTNGNKKVSIWKDVPKFSGEFNDKGIGFGCHCK